MSHTAAPTRGSDSSHTRWCTPQLLDDNLTYEAGHSASDAASEGEGMGRSARAGAIALIAVALAACSGVGAPAGPSDGSQAASSGTPGASAGAVASQALSAMAPDAFWASLFSGEPEAVNYPSLPSLSAMASDSDLVVLGTLESVTAGPDSDVGSGSTNHMLTVRVRVERVLRGDLPAGATTVPVTVFLGVGPAGGANPYADEIARRAAAMPRERGVFFLQNLVAYYSRFDATAAKRYDPSVYQVSSLQGVVRDDAGTARVSARAPGSWAAALGGKPFGDVLAGIESALGA